MSLEKIFNQTIRQKVYDQLKSRIVSAEIAPGEMIKLRDLSAELGVSIMPIREALWQLESEKIVVVRSNKDIRVNVLSAEEMEEALRIRLVLESMACELSCEQRPETALPRVKRLLEDMQESMDKPKRYLRKNSEFHFAIYECADSPMLLQIIDLLWARIGPYLSIVIAKESDFSFSMKSHRGMYEAFVKKDKVSLIKFLRQDLEEAAKFIIPFLNRTAQKETLLSKK